MRREDFTLAQQANLVSIGADALAYCPPPLPPNIEASPDFWEAFGLAERELGRLDGLSRRIGNPHLVSGLLSQREAVLSSRIEGTQASVRDVLLFEADPSIELEVPDVREVSNHYHALNLGLELLHKLPLGLRLIREVHGRLMQGVRGGASKPGEWRNAQVHIGSGRGGLALASYVPPPVPQMQDALHKLEHYINSADKLPPLLRIALVHYQFEAIHPFFDGNGRCGRLLITLMLQGWNVLPYPLLFMADYLERNRPEYYRGLSEVSRSAAWENWLRYFINGVAEQARDSVRRCEGLIQLRQQYEEVTSNLRSPLVLRVLDLIFSQPYLTISQALAASGMGRASAKRLFDQLLSAGLLSELTGFRRNRIFCADSIFAVISAEPDTSVFGAPQ